MPSRFLQELDNRILYLDGAMGTAVHSLDLELEKDYLGKENCPEVLLKTRPEEIRGIHESFLEVGCDAVETNSFGSMAHVLQEFQLEDEAYEISRLAAQTTREACDKYSTEDKPRFAVGTMGPGTKLITLGQIDWDTMYESYREAARGLIDGGADVLLIETAQDILQVKCVINAMVAAMEDCGTQPAVKAGDEGIPIMAQVTIEQMGTMLAGTDIAAAAHILKGYPIASIGMNCATGPKDMAEHVEWLGKHWPGRISLAPNAGLPVLVEGRTEYPLQPDSFAEQMDKFIADYGLNIVGGCCGTTPEHLGALIERVGPRAPTRPEKEAMEPSCTSLYNPVEYRQDNSLLNVGERTNASGSRKFKRLLEEEDWDEIVSLAREQVREGSHVIDVNVDYAGRDNAQDMATVVEKLVRQVNVPLMLDSTNPEVIEAGLKKTGGKCLINSANLEEGEEKFAQMCELAKKHNAALVLGTIDEDPDQAMARTEERKISIAKREYELAVNKHGLDAEDIFYDPLVLPISTGMEEDKRSGLETIRGVKRIAEELPETQTTVGLSNVSFGLKPAARQVLNSAFLDELRQNGLISAIVHVSKILPQNRIDDELWNAALDLIYCREPEEPVTLADGTETKDPLQIFIDKFPDDAAEQSMKEDLSELPLDDRLQKYIIDGEKKGLTETLDEAMEHYKPLDIINEHLLGGMKVVGELFGSGKMQLPFVLQSAEVMKMAVAHLEPHMERQDGDTKGKIVLATVKGDVHDIGKNLVDIILSNNGYTVYNLGIKQPISDIIEAYNQYDADAIGLSGLLVKSVNVMEDNLRELNEQGIDVPMLLGGAALARNYCESHMRSVYNGRVYHGKDAFEGLRVMDRIMEGRTDELEQEIDERLNKRAETEEKVAAMKEKEEEKKAGGTGSGEGGTAVAEAPTKSNVATDVDVPTPPFWGDRIVEDIPLDQVYPFINKIALYRGQWQFRKGSLSQEDYDKLIEEEVEPLFDRLRQQCKDEGILKPQVAYGYFPCQGDGEDLVIYDPEDHKTEVERFSFPRQDGKKRLCISDFFRSVDSGEIDVVGMTCVTVGQEATRRAMELFESDQYQEYLYLHGFGVETAEALAEFWHKRMRQELGMDADDATEMKKLIAQGYRGSRYSFGYPACPNMGDQTKLFGLLKPDRIGCTLTDNWQIDPEQSTSAIVVHHPEAKYFNI